jgi:hypothetical protein
MTAGREGSSIRSRSAVACLLIVMLATACTHVVDGTVHPAKNLKPRPLTGQTIKQVLLDADALGKMLDQPFKSDTDLPPWFGGPDKLRSSYSASPSRRDCLGVTTIQEKGIYKSAAIDSVAGESWWHEGSSAKVISVTEGVVALPTVAAANELFAKFSAQWRQCDGVAIDLPADRLSFTDTISDVRLANSVLAATVASKSNRPGASAIPEARALGVRVNCLVEVEVAFYSSRRSSDQGSAEVATSGIDVARALMDKVTALS